MPIYDYVCSDKMCGNRFEKIVRKMDDSETTCPKCGQPASKVLSKPAPFVWGVGGGFA